MTRQHHAATFAPSRDPGFAMSPSESDPASVPFTTTGFVGRERELRELTAAFDHAVEGEGSLAMVVGEPGIGKTTLCGQLGGYVGA